MRSSQSILSNIWATVSRILKMHSEGDVFPNDLLDEENIALNVFADHIAYVYCSTASQFEYNVNQTMAMQYVTKLDSSDIMQFSIYPQDISIDILLDSDKSDWRKLLKISDGVLFCKNFKLRCHIRLSALNDLFGVDAAVAKQLKTLFGTAYHGVDIVSSDIVPVATSSEICHSILETCNMLKHNMLNQMKNSLTLYKYLSRYKSAVELYSK